MNMFNVLRKRGPLFYFLAFIACGSKLAAADPQFQWYANAGAPLSGNGFEAILKAVKGKDGNIYIAGSTRRSISWGDREDIVTAKYSSLGTLAWAVSFNSGSDGRDAGHAITADSGGNVYVAGLIDTGHFGASHAIVVIKYSSTGTRVWVQHPVSLFGSGSGTAIGLDTDSSGNVFVTCSITDDTGQTVGKSYRYSPSGTLLAEYSHIVPVAMAVAADGTLHVAGYAVVGNGNNDFIIDVFPGGITTATRVIYGTPELSDDRPTAMALDANGNIYLTGTTRPSGQNNYYVTVKMAKSGSTYSLGWAGFWAPGTLTDNASAIAVEGAGATAVVYVTGLSLNSDGTWVPATRRYNATGGIVWSQRLTAAGRNFSTPSLALTANNVVVAASSGANSDFGALAYSKSTGASAWGPTYYDDPVGGSDVVVNVFSDGSDGGIVAGGIDAARTDNSLQQTTTPNFGVVRFSSAGVATLAASTDLPTKGVDDLRAITTDGSAVYVTGTTEVYRSDIQMVVFRILTIKYSSSGSVLWSTETESGNYPSCIAVNNGQVVVAGSTYDGLSTFTMKYNVNGVVSWTQIDSGNGYAAVAAIDSSANTYTFTGAGQLVKRASADGALIFSTSAINPGPQAMLLDSANNLYVAGALAVAKYNPASGAPFYTREWLQTATVTPAWWSIFGVNASLALDSRGNVQAGFLYLGQRTSSSTYDGEIMTVRYTTAGAGQRVLQINTGPVSGVAVDKGGNLYTTYSFEDFNTWQNDVGIQKYHAANGALLATGQFDGGSLDYDSSRAIVAAAPSAYIGGQSWHPGTSLNYTTLKYNYVNAAPIAYGKTIEVLRDVATAIVLEGADGEDNSLTPVSITAPLHGTVSAPSGLTVTYTPSAGYTGPDSFTFGVNDGSLSSGAATMSINVVAIPAITTQPQNQVVCIGNTLTLSVTATGGALTYQWRKNGVAISGATASTYVKTGFQSADAGSYTVVVANSQGSVTSSAATVTDGNPVVTSQPASQTVCSGNNATFTVTATGPGLTYQWQRNAVNIAGATSATYVRMGVTTADNGSKYQVVVTSSGGCTKSSTAATLTVNASPVITGQPAAQTVCVGGTATFTVTASGTGLAYQWQRNGVDIAGATSATYARSSVTSADNNTSYRAIVRNAVGCSVSSAFVLLTVNSPPTITAQPGHQTVRVGANATFSVTASGSGLTYQWQRNGVDIAGATSSTYVRASVTSGDDNSAYAATIGNSAGCNTLSAAGILRVFSTTYGFQIASGYVGDPTYTPVAALAIDEVGLAGGYGVAPPQAGGPPVSYGFTWDTVEGGGIAGRPWTSNPNCPNLYNPNDNYYWASRINTISDGLAMGWIGYDASDVPSAATWQNGATPVGGCATFDYYSEVKGYRASGVNSLVGYSQASARRGNLSAGWTEVLAGQPGSPGSVANGVNATGEAVGSSKDATFNRRAACYWAVNGTLTLLPAPSALESEALSINDAGTIVGYRILSDLNQRACVWTKVNQTYEIADLGVLPSSTYSVATAINSSGQIIGYSGGKACVWFNNTAFDLNLCVPSPNGYTMVRAYGINDSGQIVGCTSWGAETSPPALYPPNTAARPFALTPQ